MARKKQALDSVDATVPERADGAAESPQTLPGRPRLGDPSDPWSVVIKDVVREAPKTTVVVAGAILLALLSLIASLIALHTGSDATASPIDSLIQRALMEVAGACGTTPSSD